MPIHEECIINAIVKLIKCYCHFFFFFLLIHISSYVHKRRFPIPSRWHLSAVKWIVNGVLGILIWNKKFLIRIIFHTLYHWTSRICNNNREIIVIIKVHNVCFYFHWKHLFTSNKRYNVVLTIIIATAYECFCIYIVICTDNWPIVSLEERNIFIMLSLWTFVSSRHVTKGRKQS